MVEVKSLTELNERYQMRMGIGQLLEYQHRLSETVPDITTILAVEQKPSAHELWLGLCKKHGISLVWPEIFDTIDFKN